MAMLVTSRPFEAGLRSGLRGVRNGRTHAVVGVVAVLAVAALLGGGGGAALGAAPGCNLAPQLRDLTINQGLGSYTPLAWGKDTLFRLYMSQPSCAASGGSDSGHPAPPSLSGEAAAGAGPLTATPNCW